MLGKRGNVMFILLLSIDNFLYIVKSLQFRSGLPGGPLNITIGPIHSPWTNASRRLEVGFIHDAKTQIKFYMA
jgi:hypothetical protein